MPDRYTSRDVENVVRHLAAMTGNRMADPTWKTTDKRRDGAWIIDHNSVYGGYVVCAYVPDSTHDDGRPQTYTAQTLPLGERRRSAREMCETLHFALRVLNVRKPRRRAR